jgi:hypothetical protein
VWAIIRSGRASESGVVPVVGQCLLVIDVTDLTIGAGSGLRLVVATLTLKSLW